ncbi:2OG-Fe dioxygenase family protein [Micromonospora sp. WMMD1102]|uniref:2OG-Fe dioxygenase family protein n=1 Tax=Micromonospora sp. WMMD1102 TaxID=3016105 RepID=UPI002414E26E|nr:2OG-Fe dioxygenase family protein [Micromonospora sp. WMMD1102]MDG4785114.1 2OG-Fe dioxygenase family protein [Micromonospora sp. WMMD1102]
MRTEDAVLPRSQDIAEKGWSHGRLPVSANADWREFASAWDDLPIDPYVRPSHRTSRYRRLGRLLARGDGSVERLPTGAFVQGRDVNRVYGGQVRVFEPLLGKTHDNATFQATIAHDLDLVRQVEEKETEWVITVHAIRVIATGDAASAPAPEGRHSDGHDYVIMHLVGRENCLGGLSRLFRKGEDVPLFEHTLLAPMETLVLNDRTMEHEVTPIVPGGSSTAIRDMMIVDFERA